MRFTIAAALLLGGAALHAQVLEPRIGFALGRDGTLLEVRGLSGAFVVDRTNVRAALAASSGELCVVRRGDSIEILDARRAAVERPDHARRRRAASSDIRPSGRLNGAADAVFGFSGDGQSVAVFRPQSSDLAVWRSGEWTITPVSAGLLGGDVASVALEKDAALLAVMRGSGISLIRIRTSDGAVEQDMPLEGAHGPVLVLAGGGIVFAKDATITLQNAAGSRSNVDLPAAISRLSQIGDQWIEAATSAGATFAIRLDAPRAHAIPEALQ